MHGLNPRIVRLGIDKNTVEGINIKKYIYFILGNLKFSAKVLIIDRQTGTGIVKINKWMGKANKITVKKPSQYICKKISGYLYHDG